MRFRTDVRPVLAKAHHVLAFRRVANALPVDSACIYAAMVGEIEDELRIDVEDALAGLDGLEVRRMFSGWGFYRRSLLFAACWDGEFRWRTRQEGRWVYVPVERSLLERPDELTARAAEVIAVLDVEPAAARPRRRGR